MFVSAAGPVAADDGGDGVGATVGNEKLVAGSAEHSDVAEPAGLVAELAVEPVAELAVEPVVGLDAEPEPLEFAAEHELVELVTEPEHVEFVMEHEPVEFVVESEPVALVIEPAELVAEFVLVADLVTESEPDVELEHLELVTEAAEPVLAVVELALDELAVAGSELVLLADVEWELVQLAVVELAPDELAVVEPELVLLADVEQELVQPAVAELAPDELAVVEPEPDELAVVPAPDELAVVEPELVVILADAEQELVAEAVELVLV